VDHTLTTNAFTLDGYRIRYDATEIMNGVTEVLCYGTAVFVERSERR
jgi:uncharacterized protein YbjQ (UPF0145 family)